MPSEAAQALQDKLEGFLSKLDDASSRRANDPSTTDQSVAETQQQPVSDRTKRRVDALMGRQRPDNDRPKRHDDAPTTDQSVTMTHQRPDKPRKQGRRWTDDDYRLRGMPTPEERAAKPKRVRLNTFVDARTHLALRRLATELGVTLGEALDQLVEGA